MTTVGSPNYTASRCPVAPAGNLCAPENLGPFTAAGPEIARKASIICYAESHGNQNCVDPSCTDPASRTSCADPKSKVCILFGCGTQYPKSYDVGLFQIGLWTWCPGAFTKVVPNTCPENQNVDVLQACVTKYLNAADNIQKAWEISKGGTYWWPWVTSRPQYCNIQ